MKNTFDRTIYSLCKEIDDLKEEVSFWRDLYEKENRENMEMINKNLEESKKGVVTALMFALSTRDDENGNLIIDKENRQQLAEHFDNK